MVKVTVVIPYYNNEKTIIRALDSVLNQSFNNIEVILINDGSTDMSGYIVDKYIEKTSFKQVKNINQENFGPSKSRNVGILEAKGEYVAFLDADDEWDINKLKVQLSILESNKDIDMLGCNFNIIKENQVEKKYFVKENIKKITLKMLMFKHYFATPCVIAKKDVLLACGMFEQNQHYMEDALLFSNIARNFNAYMINEFMVNTYKDSFGESGLSGKLNEMEKYELKNFMYLYRENESSKEKVNVIILFSAVIFSLVKYIRRKLVVFFRS